ncbi:hypothetical protein ACFFWA_15440 [Actinomadura verrucosospora]|uniref:hypothetical protein n=1 Tax=Actinomadura verrucosospora TaxID=46165 RepID=UPI0031E5ED84
MNLFERFSKVEREAARAVRAEHKKKEREARDERQERLDKAAGVASVEVVCHADTWDFVRTKAPRFEGRPFSFFSGTGDRLDPEPDADGLVHITLSGPNLVKLLDWMWSASQSTDPVERALAKRIYNGAAAVVDTVDPSVQPGLALPPIVIDDRVPPPA